MADNKDLKVNVIVGAEADAAGIKKEVKKIPGIIDSSFKGGHIKVPVDITVPIDKNKDKLTKAQKAVVLKLNKMTTKGFSASGKDIDDLISKFNEFTKTLDKSRKR